VKVIAMDQAMRLPFKVSTATSSFMIGVAAAELDPHSWIQLDRGVCRSARPRFRRDHLDCRRHPVL
jgi:hypothetical protein